MSPPEPKLDVRVGARPVRAVALVLHGGQAKSMRTVPPWSLAYLRMHPFVTALAEAGGEYGLAVASLRHAVRGWNGQQRSPVADARWALDQVRDRFGEVDVALVGHSMGGRTALAVADDPSVRVVVALAPWIEPQDSIDPVSGRTLLIAHGTSDHMTSPSQSAHFAESARAIAKQVTYVSVTGERHALLHKARFWHQLVAGYTVAALLNRPPNGTKDADAANVIAAATAGTATIRI